MSYYKTKQNELAASFKFQTNSPEVSPKIIQKYLSVKKLFHSSILSFESYKLVNSNKITDYYNSAVIIDKLCTFYTQLDMLLTYFLDQILRGAYERKKYLLEILNKLFRLMYVFDITRHKHSAIFHDFARLKQLMALDKQKILTEKQIMKLSTFSAISMPMARLFISFFCTDKKEVCIPTKIIRRGSLHTDEFKRDSIYFLSKLMCRINEYEFCKIFFSGLFNCFFHSQVLRDAMDHMSIQKQAYYVALADMC